MIQKYSASTICAKKLASIPDIFLMLVDFLPSASSSDSMTVRRDCQTQARKTLISHLDSTHPFFLSIRKGIVMLVNQNMFKVIDL